MKRFLFFSILALLIIACAPQETQTETVVETQPTATLEAASLAAESAAAPEETPLPDEVNTPLIETPAIINIEMLDEVYGWAVTEEHITRTNDGGVTWYDVTPANLADAGYLVYTDFFDKDHAWVQFPDMNNYPNAGKLYRTTDGGITWESFTTPFSGGAIKFLDEKNGWMMADLGVGAGSMAVSIFQTSDGGETWERIYTNDPNLEGAGETLPLGGIKNVFLPLDEENAWVGGVVYAPGEMYLFRSRDGGDSWIQINVVLPEEAAEGEVSVLGLQFISDTKGLLALRVTSDNPETVVYLTEDGGNTWERLPVEFNGYGILEIVSASEMIFYANDQFHVTTDAGETITTVTPDIEFGDTISDMSFANSQTGWALTYDQILFKTTDGGATWTQLVP